MFFTYRDIVLKINVYEFYRKRSARISWKEHVKTFIVLLHYVEAFTWSTTYFKKINYRRFAAI